jgi:hypothetical protein
VTGPVVSNPRACWRAPLILLAFTLVACVGNVPAEPHRILPPASSASTAPSDASRAPTAIVSRVGFTCPYEPDHEIDRLNGLWLYPTLGALQFVCGGGTSFALVDPDGRIGPELPVFWGVPGATRRDHVQGAYTAGATRWLALETSADEHGRKTLPMLRFLFQDQGGAWTPVVARAEGRWRVASMGPWPGGAILTAFVEWADHGEVELHVVHGTPTAPLPRLEELVGRRFRFLTTDRGRAYAAWNVSSPEGGINTRVWDAKKMEWMEEIIPGIALAGSGLVAGHHGVYFAGDNVFESSRRRFVKVMRLDGDRWVSSCTIPNARAPSILLTPDGAVWLRVSLQGDNTPGGRSEIWRRRPGAVDEWDQIAPDVVGRHTELSAGGMMPAGNHDIYFVGGADRSGFGLYRVHLEGL